MANLNIDIPYFLFIGLLPSIEPRYSVPTCILVSKSLPICTFIGILDVILLSIILTYIVNFLDSTLQQHSIFSHIYKKYISRIRRQAAKLKQASLIMLIIFIAAPLPGTGIWSGAFLAYTLGLRRRDTLVALLIGGLLSLAITIIPTLTAIYVISDLHMLK
ncbi:MAG TPA: hypothetical protein EYH26_04085 [Pyrodictium sp.]|nr:hypothetical protein [Pyrodictium sp.]